MSKFMTTYGWKLKEAEHYPEYDDVALVKLLPLNGTVIY